MGITHNNFGAKVRLATSFDGGLYKNLEKYSGLDIKVFNNLIVRFPARVLGSVDSFKGISVSFAAHALLSREMGEVILEMPETINKLDSTTLAELAREHPEQIQNKLHHIDPSKHNEIATAILDDDPKARLEIEYRGWQNLDGKVADELIQRGQAKQALQALFESFDAEGQTRIISGVVARRVLGDISSLGSKLGLASENGLHGDFFISSLCSSGYGNMAGNQIRHFKGLSLSTRQTLVSCGQGDATMQFAENFGPLPPKASPAKGVGR